MPITLLYLSPAVPARGFCSFSRSPLGQSYFICSTVLRCRSLDPEEVVLIAFPSSIAYQQDRRPVSVFLFHRSYRLFISRVQFCINLASTNSHKICTGMEKKRKLSEAIKKNDQATRKKTTLIHNQTWDALGVDILAKIFDLLPSEDLFWNVSLVCHNWQLASWDKLFWNNNNGCLDLRAVAPFQCCSLMPKGIHNHKCSELMKHLLQTILFRTHDALRNSLEEWRNSIKTIRIPFGLEMCDDFLLSLPSAVVVVAEPAAPRALLVRPLVVSNFKEPDRPLVLSEVQKVVQEVVLSWTLKRLLLESPLFGKPIFTHFVDVSEVDVFENILRTTFKRSSIDLKGLYCSNAVPNDMMEYVRTNLKALFRSQSAGVVNRCRKLSLDLKMMVELFTKCGILPDVLIVAEHRYFVQHPKARKFREDPSAFLPFEDESLELACQWKSRCQIREFWLAVKELFSNDKKNLSLAWESCQGKSVFLDHYYKVAQTQCSHLDPLALERAAESEWDSLLVQEGVRKVPKKKQRLGSLAVAETIEIRKSIFPYSKYKETAKHRREFVKKLLKVRHSGYVVAPDGADRRSQHIRQSLVKMRLWGGGPYEYLEEYLSRLYSSKTKEVSAESIAVPNSNLSFGKQK